METTNGMRAIKNLFGFPLQDEQKGQKFLIGSLVFLSGIFIPVIPWIALWGYAARIMKNSIEGKPPRLPEWDRWDILLADGLRLSVVGLLLNLPAVLLYFLGIGTYLGGFLGTVVAQETAGNELAGPFVLLLFGSMGVMFLSISAATLLSIAGWFLIPPVSAHVAATGRFSAIFDVKGWGKVLSANLGGFVLVCFTMFGLWAVGYLIFYLIYMTFVLCVFLPIILAPFTVYLVAVSAEMAGQSYREAREKLGQAAGGEPAVVVEGAVVDL